MVTLSISTETAGVQLLIFGQEPGVLCLQSQFFRPGEERTVSFDGHVDEVHLITTVNLNGSTNQLLCGMLEGAKAAVLARVKVTIALEERAPHRQPIGLDEAQLFWGDVTAHVSSCSGS